jgi:hypothetical protein
VKCNDTGSLEELVKQPAPEPVKGEAS